MLRLNNQLCHLVFARGCRAEKASFEFCCRPPTRSSLSESKIGCRESKVLDELFLKCLNFVSEILFLNFSDPIPFGFRELLSVEVRGKASLLLGLTTVVGESFHPCCYALQMGEAGVAVHLRTGKLVWQTI